MAERPIIALTAGDPAGIGPEIIWKLMADPQTAALAKVVVLGDETALVKAAGVVGLKPAINIIDDPGQGRYRPGQIDLIPCSRLTEKEHRFCHTDALCGEAAYQAICRAVSLVVGGRAEAICTAPLAKSSLHAAGRKFPGHTELLAKLSGATDDPVMLLAGPKLKVALATTHMPLSQVPTSLNPDSLLRIIGLAADFSRRLGASNPRVAVCGLNPHAGEGGLFGTEETRFIYPALERAAKAGIIVSGPEPGDTVFHRAAEGEFDVVVAMYHDQGLGPLKTLHFRQAVNVTLGLPIIRTSVGHGTAFELAGRAEADPTSLKAALLLATKLARPGADIQVW